MVSQADRDLIRNFVTELRPYLETVGQGVQEFAQPTRDGVIIGQAIQALGMIRGAGSILMVDGLVTIAEMLSDAFEIIQRNTDISAQKASRLLVGLTVPLEGYLSALDRGEDTSTYLIQARAAFDAIPVYRGPIPGTASLANRSDLDALFGDTAPVTRADEESSAPTVVFSEDAADLVILPVSGEGAGESLSASAEGPVTRDDSSSYNQTIPLQSNAPEYPRPLDLASYHEMSDRPPRVIPDQALETEKLPEIDPELREIFIEEAATLVVSFGENAKAVAQAPADYEPAAQLRRDAHTLKGAANMTGFPLIGRLGAAVENLLDEHIDREIPVTRDTLELVLVCWKMLRAMMTRLDHLSPFVSPVTSAVQRAETLRQELVANVQAPAADVREADDRVIGEPASGEIDAMKKLGGEPEPQTAEADVVVAAADDSELPEDLAGAEEDVVVAWDGLSEAERDAADRVRRDMEDTAEIVAVDEPDATVVLNSQDAPEDVPVDSQVDEDWLRPPDWSIENDQVDAVGPDEVAEPAASADWAAEQTETEVPQAESTLGDEEFWSPVKEQDSEQATVVLTDTGQWTPDAEAETTVEAVPEHSDEIIVTDPFRDMVGGESNGSEIPYPFAADDQGPQDDFWSPVNELESTEEHALPEGEPDAEWLSEEPAAFADSPPSQAETVVLSSPEPFWSTEDAPALDEPLVEGEVVQHSAETFWRAINDDQVFSDEFGDPVEGLENAQRAEEADELVEEAVAADHDLDAADVVEAFWCPEELLAAATSPEVADEPAMDVEAEHIEASDELLEDLVPDWSRDMVAETEVEATVIEDADLASPDTGETEDLLIEAGEVDLDDFESPEWLDDLDDEPEPVEVGDAGEDVLLSDAVADQPVDEPVAGVDVAEQANGLGALPLDIQDLRDRSRSAELGSALLDLAFSVEAGPAPDDPGTEANVAVLDENAEAQFALEMFETFALECTDHVEALNLAAMQLDRNPGIVEPLREVKRALHTLKGAAAAAEFDRISERCHRLEDSLLTMERADGSVARPFVEDLFTAIEDIERMLEARRVELFGAGDDAPVDETARSRQSLRVDLVRIDALLNTVGELVVNRAGLEQRLERLAVTLEELSLTANRLQRSGYLIERERYADDPIARFIRGELLPSGIASLDGTREFPADWDELEMDRYTEFDRLIRQLGEVGADVGTAVNEIAQLRGDLDTISTRQRRLTTNLQDELMDVRMVPIASMAPRLYRVVRRVARSRDKLVNLVLEGGETPFDKMLLDALSEPLLHLLRNAVDHGIETTGERRRLGKPETGTVKIRAYRDGNEAVIDILDDGAGIDQAGVLQHAREIGMQVDADISSREALQFIFLPGFSTRSTADEVSGRGVGLDIVEQTITQYKGRVAVDSIPGQGTIFSLRLPVMLAVTQAFLVVAGGARYAIPIANIESVADREDQPLTLIGDTVVVERGDTAIPVVDLSARFGRTDVPLMERESGWVMIADVDGQSWALVVDELHGQQEVVVRSLGRFLRATPGMMGATILGNGDVALIIDVPQLFSDRTRVAGPGEMIRDGLPALPETPATEDKERASVALVVDDSLSVRRVVGRTLERHGWAVLLARDGVEALELLEDGPVDVVVTDIEMPRMDGFDLLTSVRARRNLRDLPVVVLTSRSGEKHRGRALELGANGYLVKPFQEQDLVEMVTQSSRLAAVGGD